MDTPHTRPDNDRRSRDRLIRTYCWTLVLLAVYVLSTGPMYWQIYEAYHTNGSSWIAALYFPLVLACEIPAVNDWFNWYIGLWLGV